MTWPDCWSNGANAGDLDGMVALYETDAVVELPGGPDAVLVVDETGDVKKGKVTSPTTAARRPRWRGASRTARGCG